MAASLPHKRRVAHRIAPSRASAASPLARIGESILKSNPRLRGHETTRGKNDPRPFLDKPGVEVGSDVGRNRNPTMSMVSAPQTAAIIKRLAAMAKRLAGLLRLD